VRLSVRLDYALRAAVELAAAELADSSNAVRNNAELAERQGIPVRFLGAILRQLRTADIVRSVRGRDGGFALARPAAKISLADVIRAVEGPLALVGGERPEAHDYRGAAVALQDVWIALRARERSLLDQVTLAQVATGELPPEVRAARSDQA
jgi:Rrf2 family protein